MKKLFLLLFLSLAFNTSSFIQCIEPLSFNDSNKAQLVLNFAFFTWYRAYAEYLSVTQLDALLAEILDLRIENEKYALPAHETLTLQHMAKSLADIWSKRSVAISIHNKLTDQLMSSSDQELRNIVPSLSQDITTKITQIAGDYSKSIEESFAQFSDKRAQLISYLEKINDSSNSIESANTIQQAEMNRAMLNYIESGSLLLLSYSLPFRNINTALQIEGLTLLRENYETIHKIAIANNYPQETFAVLATDDEQNILTFSILPDPSMLLN